MSLCDGSELLFVVISILSPSLPCDLMQFVGNYLLFVELFAFNRQLFALYRQNKPMHNQLITINKLHLF